MIGPDTAWNQLADRLPLTTALARLGNAQPEQPDRMTTTWNDAASTSMSHRFPVVRSTGVSAWVTAAPTDVVPDLVQKLGPEMHARGATLIAPILADDPSGIRHTFYRQWFELAAALEAGRLAAVAFVDVQKAVRHAAETSHGDYRVAYNEATDHVEVSSAATRVVFEAEPLAFMAVMRGQLPEPALCAAVEASSLCIERITALGTAVRDAVGPHGVRYADGTPVYRVDERLIADPDGAAFLAGEPLPAGWEDRLRAGVAELSSPVCICGASRRVQAILRKTQDLFFLEENGASVGIVASAVGPRHALAYELRCPHVAQRLTSERARAEGWDGAQCHGSWSSDPVTGKLLVGRNSRFGYTATVLHGEEVGALASDPSLLDSACATLGYGAGAELTVYVPTAHVLLVTDEPIEVVRQILRKRSSQDELLGSLLHRGVRVGREVGFMSSVVVSTSAVDPRLQRRLVPLDDATGSPGHTMPAPAPPGFR